MRPRLWIALAVAAVAVGCKDDASPPPLDMSIGDIARVPALCVDDTASDGGPPGTFTNVQRIFDYSCNLVCHPGLATGGGMTADYSDGHAYMDIVNQVAPDPHNAACGKIVVPYHPEQSYIIQKLNASPTMLPCYGEPMPVGEPINYSPLPGCQIDVIRRWIRDGAKP